MARSFLTSINLNKNELLNARIQNLPAAPSSPVEGQIYFHSTDKNLYTWDGTQWVDLTVQGGALSYAAPSATINAGDTVSEGVAATVLRSDAQFAVATGLASTISGSNAEGVSSNLARADHDHQLGANIVGTSHLAAGVRLDTINAPTAAVSLNNQKITGLADGTVAGDAVNLGQLQSAQAGIDPKQSVRTATTAAGALATDFENLDTVGGVVVATGDRILIKDQVAPAENGIYTVNATGAPTRATDFDSWGEVPGATVIVEDGTNADTAWISTANAGGTLGTTAITFTRWDVGAVTAGAGLTKTNNTLDVVGTANRIVVNADSIDIASTYVGQTSITTLGTITAGVWNGTDIAIADGGTGASTATGARTNLGATGKYATDFGDGAALSYTITHNLGTKDVTVALWDNTTPFAEVWADVEHTTINTITITGLSVAPTANQYRVVVVG